MEVVVVLYTVLMTVTIVDVIVVVSSSKPQGKLSIFPRSVQPKKVGSPLILQFDSPSQGEFEVEILDAAHA